MQPDNDDARSPPPLAVPASSVEAQASTSAGERPARRSERPGGPASLVGTVISDRYRIDRLLGEGGMGAVYLAEHLHMHKRLAVKVLHPEMSRLPEVVTRFEREAMAAGHIDHPNVATASDFGKLPDGSFFLVLEFVEGKNLRDVLAGGPLALSRALHIAQQVADALGRAHSLGIVHRDLKPENVMILERDGDRDFVKVLDFGIAKVPVGSLGEPASTGAPRQALTQMGVVFGTPDYMAPEQALGQHVDGRADLYSLGVLLFEMLTGGVPFQHDNPVMVLGMQVTAVPPSIGSKVGGGIPADVEALVARLLAKDAGQRFQDARQVVDAIAAMSRAPAVLHARGAPSRASLIWLIAVGAVGSLALLLALMAYLLRGGSGPATTGLVGGPAATSVPTPAPQTLAHRDQERAALVSGDMKAALSEATQWLRDDPTALNDGELAVDLRTIALGHEDPEAAESMLETMGSVGVDALYDLAYGYAAGPSMARARKALATPAIAARASPSLAVTLELRAARTCDKKKALLERARELGDVRTLALLREFQATTGCGFMGMKDCWSCMRRGDALATTSAAIRARLRTD